MASVLIVNNQSLQRLGLRMILAAEPDLTVAGEAVSAPEAVRMSNALRPDVVLMAGHPSGRETTDAIRRITRSPNPLPQLPDPAGAHRHRARVLVLNRAGHEEQDFASLRAGARGLLPHDIAPSELIAAVRVVASGGAVLAPDLTRALIDVVRRQHGTRPPRPDVRPRTFTGRERDVLIAVASGWSNAEIATWFSIAPSTVKSHVSHILAKIGARARVQAVTYAYESGLMQPTTDPWGTARPVEVNGSSPWPGSDVHSSLRLRPGHEAA